MWYFIHKCEGFSFLPFLMLYYRIKNMPFSVKCKRCGGWLNELQYMRSGICRPCQEKMAQQQSSEYYSKEYYSRHSQVLERPRVKPAHEPIFSRVADNISSGTILDVGCGIGYLLSKVPKKGHLYGMDMSADALGLAMTWIGNGRFCLADAQHIPYMSNTFDQVVCMEVLEHIEGNEAAKECLRVLKPGGTALITVPNGRGIYGKSHASHIRVFTLNSIQEYLVEAGFEVVRKQQFGLHIPFVTSYMALLSYLLHRNLPLSQLINVQVPEFLSVDFLIICRKPKDSAASSPKQCLSQAS